MSLDSHRTELCWITLLLLVLLPVLTESYGIFPAVHKGITEEFQIKPAQRVKVARTHYPVVTGSYSSPSHSVQKASPRIIKAQPRSSFTYNAPTQYQNSNIYLNAPLSLPGSSEESVSRVTHYRSPVQQKTSNGYSSGPSPPASYGPPTSRKSYKSPTGPSLSGYSSKRTSPSVSYGPPNHQSSQNFPPRSFQSGSPSGFLSQLSNRRSSEFSVESQEFPGTISFGGRNFGDSDESRRNFQNIFSNLDDSPELFDSREGRGDSREQFGLRLGSSETFGNVAGRQDSLEDMWANLHTAFSAQYQHPDAGSSSKFSKKTSTSYDFPTSGKHYSPKSYAPNIKISSSRSGPRRDDSVEDRYISTSSKIDAHAPQLTHYSHPTKQHAPKKEADISPDDFNNVVHQLFAALSSSSDEDELATKVEAIDFGKLTGGSAHTAPEPHTSTFYSSPDPVFKTSHNSYSTKSRDDSQEQPSLFAGLGALLANAQDSDEIVTKTKSYSAPSKPQNNYYFLNSKSSEEIDPFSSVAQSVGKFINAKLNAFKVLTELGTNVGSRILGVYNAKLPAKQESSEELDLSAVLGALSGAGGDGYKRYTRKVPDISSENGLISNIRTYQVFPADANTVETSELSKPNDDLEVYETAQTQMSQDPEEQLVVVEPRPTQNLEEVEEVTDERDALRKKLHEVEEVIEETTSQQKPRESNFKLPVSKYHGSTKKVSRRRFRRPSVHHDKKPQSKSYYDLNGKPLYSYYVQG